MGIWTISIGLSPYISALLDGFVTTYAGWRWMQWVTFFIWCGIFLVCVVALPETLYDRHHDLVEVPPKKTYMQRLKWQRFKTRQLSFRSFWHPCTMFFYPSVIFPGFYYGNLYGFCVFGALGMIPFVSFLRRQERMLAPLTCSQPGIRGELWVWSHWTRACGHSTGHRDDPGRATRRPIFRLDGPFSCQKEGRRATS